MNTYYRTGKGTKKHSSFACANARRSVRTGDPIVLAAEVAETMAPCGHCCKGEATPVAPAAKVATPRPTEFFLVNKTTGKKLVRIAAASKAEAERKARKVPAIAAIIRKMAVDGQSWTISA